MFAAVFLAVWGHLWPEFARHTVVLGALLWLASAVYGATRHTGSSWCSSHSRGPATSLGLPNHTDPLPEFLVPRSRRHEVLHVAAINALVTVAGRGAEAARVERRGCAPPIPSNSGSAFSTIVRYVTRFVRTQRSLLASGLEGRAVCHNRGRPIGCYSS